MAPLTMTLPNERVVEAANLPTLVDAYLADCSARVAPQTMTNYRNHLYPFQVWWSECATEHKNTITRSNLRLFLEWLENGYTNRRGDKATSYLIDKTLDHVRRFLEWTHDVGCVPQKISDLLPAYENKSKRRYYPKSTDVQSMFDAVYDPIYRLRDAAVISFMLATGARLMESACAQIEHLEFATPICDLRTSLDHSGFIHLAVTKGDRQGVGDGRDSMFCSKTGLIIKAWLRASGLTSGPIFALESGGIRRIIYTLSDICRLPKLHPHALRRVAINHWFKTWAAQGGGMEATISRQLQFGHKPTSTNAELHYIDVDDVDEVKTLIRRFYVSPLDGVEFRWIEYPVQIDTSI